MENLVYYYTICYWAWMVFVFGHCLGKQDNSSAGGWLIFMAAQSPILGRIMGWW
jgi:hypothetical protein